MTNTIKYSYSEILSFYTPCNPPHYFQSDSPIFTHVSQEPITLSNPNPPFIPKPFNFVPKKSRINDTSIEDNQKYVQPSKVIDFRPQLIKEDKNENYLNKTNDAESLFNQSNKYRFRPESIGKPLSSSAPPTLNNDTKQNNTQIPSGNEILNFKPQKEVKSTEEITKNSNENNTIVFRPKKEEKKTEVQQNDNTQSISQEMQKNKDENNKSTPWGNISMKTNSVPPRSKKNEEFEKVNSVQIQLQKEIDNSLISSSNSSDEHQKIHSNIGFAPKKLDQAYEAPELPTENISKPKQNRKTLTNFDEIEKEELTQKDQKQNQQPQQQPKKGLFESLLEQEKQNQNKSSKKEIDIDDEIPPKKQSLQKVGFAPKVSGHLFEGPSIDEINKPNNSNNNTKEVKSGFSALMEQEKISSEREKKEKELEKEKQNKVKKPSIVDILIAETIQEKSKEKPKENEEIVPEEKPVFQAFKPIKANASYEAPSIEEIESFSKNQQKKTTFSEALSNQNKNSKPSFEELQKSEPAKQAQTKKQGPSSNAPSFFDLLVKEEKKEKQITQSAKNSNVNKEEKSAQKATTGFNPKRSKPNAGSFSEMLDKEKQKESQLKNKESDITPTVKVNVQSGSKRTGNFPSFAQLINEEVRLEEQRSSPLPQISSGPPMSGKTTSFQQKVEDEEYRVETSAIGDFVSVQGELPKKWINKKNRGRKRGGRGGNVRAEENSEFFWGTPNTNIDDNIEMEDDQNSQNWPSVQGQNEEDDSSNFGFGNARKPQKKDARISWLSKILEDELGEENPWEFAESLVNKSKPEMIRFLSTITFDQQQASNIATRFYQTFPAK